MAKKRKSNATRLDEVDRGMYTSFCGAANFLFLLYSQAMHQPHVSVHTGEPHTLLMSSPGESGYGLRRIVNSIPNANEKVYSWILRQQEDGVRVMPGDIAVYVEDWKTERYKEIIKSGTVERRPWVLRLMDKAKASGKKLAVCSAATKSSVITCLENLIGMDRFQNLDCFLAGDEYHIMLVHLF